MPLFRVSCGRAYRIVVDAETPGAAMQEALSDIPTSIDTLGEFVRARQVGKRDVWYGLTEVYLEKAGLLKKGSDA